MASLPWNDDLHTGIAAVDEQHQWLVETANHLHEQVSTPGPDNAAAGEALFGLLDYLHNHFVMEEDLFQRLGHTDRDGLRARHNALLQEVTALLDRHEHGDPMTPATVERLQALLLAHVVDTDKPTIATLKAAGAL